MATLGGDKLKQRVRGERIAEKYVDLKSDGKLTNPGVMSLGRCNPGWEEKNYREYGFGCPRDHYVYGPADVTPSQVAKVWGLSVDTVFYWRNSQKWETMKQAFLATQPATLGGLVETPDIQALQEKVVSDQLRDLDEALGMTLDRMRAKTEEVNTALGPEQMKKSDASFVKLVGALIDLHEQKRVAAGLHTKMSGALAGANVDARQVSVTVVERPKNAYSPHAALQAAKSEDETGSTPESDGENLLEGELE